jgi:hypothetical protein
VRTSLSPRWVSKGRPRGHVHGQFPGLSYAWFGLNKIGSIMVPVNTGFLHNETQIITNHELPRNLSDENSSTPRAPRREAEPICRMGAVRGNSGNENIVPR